MRRDAIASRPGARLRHRRGGRGAGEVSPTPPEPWHQTGCGSPACRLRSAAATRGPTSIASAPIHNPIEMGSDWSQVLGKLRQDPALTAQAAAAYPQGLTEESIVDAIATFERSLITPAPFDRYLRGDGSAIGLGAARGYELFKDYGCVACHQGVNVGGNMFQVFGVMGDYFARRGGPTQADLGRFNVTGLEADKHVFKVPSLRNVALTAPYFHDGSARTLEDAVDVMFRYQLGRSAPAEDKALIVEFLHTLTGDKQARSLVATR